MPKDLKVGSWEEKQQGWGFTIDTRNGTLGMSRVRLARALRYLDEPLWRWGNKEIRLRDMQRLFGSARWYSQANRSMASALADMRRMLSSDDPSGRWVSPRGSPEHKRWYWAHLWG